VVTTGGSEALAGAATGLEVAEEAIEGVALRGKELETSPFFPILSEFSDT